MSDRSSPVNGGYEAARLTVRKDLFPEVRLPKLATDGSEADSDQEDVESGAGVKLETDFEQSIDEIASHKAQVANGALPCPTRPRHRKHKHHSRQRSQFSTVNGCLPSKSKRRKDSLKDPSYRIHSKHSVVSQVKGGKNLNLVSSSECQEDEDDQEEAEEEDEEEMEEEEVAEDSESSEDEQLKRNSKLPLTTMPRQSGKPYSHELSQLSTKKSKKESRERRAHAIIPCSGKPRSMLDIRSSRSKKKSKKSESSTPTYRSQIVDTNSMKIKIRRTSVHETVTPTPTSVADIGQRKSKKKQVASPVSVSSGEEYDPSRGDTAAAMSVAAPKPRHPQPKIPKLKNKKTTSSKSKQKKSEKTERPRISGAESKETGPQSPWGRSMPKEILLHIFEYVVASQGTLPSVIRIGRVCKLWHSVSCRPELWKNVDLAQYTSEKCKTDYKLVWLLENRLSHCEILNIAQWKVSNVSWVLACVADYCPQLVELSVAGWSRITSDQLFDLMQGLTKLQRIDLSLTSETGGSSTCMSAASMTRITENFGARLTHLILANNKFIAMPQILQSIATYCLNLEVLDISGTLAASHPAAVPLEALQKGCPKMRVFRAANSQLVLGNATTAQQMECKGWPLLEELSIAGEAATERVGVGEYRLGDDALARLVRGATRLRLLDLRGLQRLTDSGLVRVPAWDLQHLFLGGCNVTRQNSACLELICEKWSHSLLELDLSWASAERVLDAAVSALADAPDSKLKILNLCGSSVTLEPIKKVLLKCPHIESINLSSCRALPRGMKRLYTGKEIQDLKDSLDPEKIKAKEIKEEESAKTKKGVKKSAADSKSEAAKQEPSADVSDKSDNKTESPSTKDATSSSVFQEPKSFSESPPNVADKQLPAKGTPVRSPDSKTLERKSGKEILAVVPEGKRSTRGTTPKLLSPHATQLRPDSSSTPRSDPVKDLGSPHFSPVAKPDSQVQNSPDVQTELLNQSQKSSNSWNLGQFKTTPTHKSEASPLNRLESHTKLKHGKVIEQCSPTTSHDNKPSPETHSIKQDNMKNPNSWNYGNYSPMPRQDSQFSSQRSPYSAQPSPAQPSPYSTQPSPYSTQPSPYSSQPSPYSAQPSPDTSQIIKPELQKSSAWNTGNYSPMPKHHPPFSPHPSTHASPDAGIGLKSDNHRSNSNKTPGHSPMSRQDRIRHSPYSPRPSVDVTYSNKKSPGVGNYSPMMRPDCHLPSPDRGSAARPTIAGRQQDIYGRTVNKAIDMMHNSAPQPEIPNSWGMDRFNQISSGNTTTNIESLVWGASSFSTEPAPLPSRVDNMPAMLNTPSPQTWPGLPSFDSSVQRPNDDLSDPWTFGQFREQPHHVHNSFVDQNSFDLSAHLGHQAQSLQSYLDDNFPETSRVE